MNQISIISVAESYGNTTATMSSREIAALTKREHSNIKISAERLAERGVIGTLATQEFSHNGNTYTEYLFGKRDSLVLVAQNCPEFTAALVDRWEALETGKAQPKMAQNEAPKQIEKPDPQAFAVVQTAWMDAVDRKIASKREALQFLRDASAVMIHGVDVLQRAVNASNTAKAKTSALEPGVRERRRLLSDSFNRGAETLEEATVSAREMAASMQAEFPYGESVPYGLRSAGTKSATELLRAHGSAVQAKEFYEVMWSKDMATARRVFENGVGNVTHRILVGDGLKYGQNVMNFDGTHSHPYFYESKFAALLKRVGLLVDATTKPTASERALRDYKNIVKEAWKNYCGETLKSADCDGIPTPYLTRSALIHYLTIELGKSEKTAKNFVAPKSDAMRALFKDEFLSKHKNGWLIFENI